MPESIMWERLILTDPQGARALGLEGVLTRGPIWRDRVRWWRLGARSVRMRSAHLTLARALEVTERALAIASLDLTTSPIARVVQAWETRGVPTALTRIMVREALRRRAAEG